MKKILFILAAIFALALTSCDKEKKHGLAGTTWVYKLDVSTTMGLTMTLKFKDNSEVDMTLEERYNNKIESETIIGTYTYVAPKVSLVFIDEDGTEERMYGDVMDNKMLIHASDDEQEGALAFIKQ